MTKQRELEQDMAEEIRKRRDFLNFTRKDEENLADLGKVAQQKTAEIVERFYEHLLKNEETSEFFQSQKHLKKVKQTQSAYFERLFDGNYDEEYGRDRLRVGRAHERIDLGPEWYIGAYSVYLCELLPTILAHYKGRPAKAVEACQSVIKIIFLDMGIAIDTYIEAMNRRERGQINKFVEALSEFSGELSTSSSGIMGATSEQTASAQQQATAISEVSTTLSELRQTSAQALEKAESVITVSEQSVTSSKSGIESVEAAAKGMQEIRDQVESIAERILSLSEQTQQVGDIIMSVSEISEQSKLLALNAAIEAARAGEHGRGFAVVATEIRSLADQSKQATAQVRKILGDIQSATNSAVVATEEGSKKVDAGLEITQRAGTSIQALADSIEESAASARLIANASRQQSTGVEEVANAMGSINEATNATAAGMRQTEDAVQAQQQMTLRMNELIEAFSKPGEKKSEFRLA